MPRRTDALSRPGRSGSQQRSLFEQCVGQQEELAHDGDHRDLPRLSLRDELTVLRAQVRVVTGSPPGPAYTEADAPAPGRPG